MPGLGAADCIGFQWYNRKSIKISAPMIVFNLQNPHQTYVWMEVAAGFIRFTLQFYSSI